MNTIIYYAILTMIIMIKFNDQSEKSKFRMGSWLLKLLPRDMKIKTKNKDQATNNHKK